MEPSKLLQSPFSSLCFKPKLCWNALCRLFTPLCYQVNTYGLPHSSVASSHLAAVHINSLIHTQLDFKQLKLRQYIQI